MPKIKTNRAAAKRFKKTGTGKLKRNKAYKSHLSSEETQSYLNLIAFQNELLGIIYLCIQIVSIDVR